MNRYSKMVSSRVGKIIKKFPTSAVVFSIDLNKYNEVQGLIEKIPTIVGFYYDKAMSSTVFIEEKGVEYTKYQHPFLTVNIDKDTSLIAKDDYIVIKDTYYQVVEVFNLHNLDMYFDIQLRKVNDPCSS